MFSIRYFFRQFHQKWWRHTLFRTRLSLLYSILVYQHKCFRAVDRKGYILSIGQFRAQWHMATSNTCRRQQWYLFSLASSSQTGDHFPSNVVLAIDLASFAVVYLLALASRCVEERPTGLSEGFFEGYPKSLWSGKHVATAGSYLRLVCWLAVGITSRPCDCLHCCAAVRL